MNAPERPLFRSEVLAGPTNRLVGHISLAAPTSWTVIIALLLTMVATCGVFLATASYKNVEVASGTIALDRGVASIPSMRAGTVAAVLVKQGDHVKAGQILAQVEAGENGKDGRASADVVLDDIQRQDRSLLDQANETARSAQAEVSRRAADATGLRGELIELDRQISSQLALLASARQDVATVTDVAKRGFISQRDLAQRKEQVTAREQQLAQLRQARLAKAELLADAAAGLAQAKAQLKSQAAVSGVARAELSQRRTATASERGYVVVAPLDGTITAVVAKGGKSVAAREELMTLIPDGATAIAELEIPENAIGFIKIGQRVDLAINAFPYETFGTVPAKIEGLATTSVDRPTSNGASAPIFLATANLSRAGVFAFGDVRPLRPGMKLTARIVTREQSLFRWLFAPLFAVQNR